MNPENPAPTTPEVTTPTTDTVTPSVTATTPTAPVTPQPVQEEVISIDLPDNPEVREYQVKVEKSGKEDDIFGEDDKTRDFMQDQMSQQNLNTMNKIEVDNIIRDNPELKDHRVKVAAFRKAHPTLTEQQLATLVTHDYKLATAKRDAAKAAVEAYKKTLSTKTPGSAGRDINSGDLAVPDFSKMTPSEFQSYSNTVAGRSHIG